MSSEPNFIVETFRRLNRVKINLDLCVNAFTPVSNFSVLAELDTATLSRLADELSLCQDRLLAITLHLKKACLVNAICTEPTRSGPGGSSRRATPTRVTSDPIDEMNDGSVNETLAPDHPYFRDTPLVYVHGGPSTCILCKETHPCGCRPPTPVDRSSMQSPPPAPKKPRKPKIPKKKECIYDMWYPCTESPPSGPCDCGCGINVPPRDAQAIPEEAESPLVMTQSDYDRYQREIADGKCHCGVTDWMTNPCSSCVLNGAPLIRSNAPSPESEIQMSDSMKALLEDKVFRK